MSDPTAIQRREHSTTGRSPDLSQAGRCYRPEELGLPFSPKAKTAALSSDAHECPFVDGSLPVNDATTADHHVETTIVSLIHLEDAFRLVHTEQGSGVSILVASTVEFSDFPTARRCLHLRQVKMHINNLPGTVRKQVTWAIPPSSGPPPSESDVLVFLYPPRYVRLTYGYNYSSRHRSFLPLPPPILLPLPIPIPPR